MGRISGWRVLLGGLFGGAVLFLGQGLLYMKLLAPGHAALARDGLWLSAEGMTGGVAVTALADLLTGFLLAWLYAAVRPRLGAGLMTAIVTGLSAWTLVFLQGFLPEYVWMPRLRDSAPLEAVVGLVLYLVATSVAAWLYSEADAGGARRKRG